MYVFFIRKIRSIGAVVGVWLVFLPQNAPEEDRETLQRYPDFLLTGQITGHQPGDKSGVYPLMAGLRKGLEGPLIRERIISSGSLGRLGGGFLARVDRINHFQNGRAARRIQPYGIG